MKCGCRTKEQDKESKSVYRTCDRTPRSAYAYVYMHYSPLLCVNGIIRQGPTEGLNFGGRAV